MGNRIKAIRKSLGKSQEEFGQLFNPPAPKSSVSYWENGGGPNKKRLNKIAELGGVSVEYLINGNKLSFDDTQQLLNKAVDGVKLSKEERQKIAESQIDFVVSQSKMTARFEKEAQGEIEEQKNIIKKQPLSLPELYAYIDILSLFNHIRLNGTINQRSEFGTFLQMVKLIVFGVIKYDKKDVLPEIDKLLSSMPIEDKPSKK